MRTIDLNSVLAKIEIALVAKALAETGGNRAAAARLLQIKRTTLVEKLKKQIRPEPEA